MKVLVIGGNRFFGKRLVEKLIDSGDEVTVLNRGTIDDGFGDKVTRVVCDRDDTEKLKSTVGSQSWDLVYDQVCFEYPQAKAACEIFNGKVKKFIFTSSKSVYEAGANIVETDFDPSKHEFAKIEDKDSNYAEAKRQAEVGFVRHADFPVTAVRFPIVVGVDDYTERFLFHFNRIRDGKPIYFPNISAKMTFIGSQFAADALFALGRSEITGPINVANPGAVALNDMVSCIEEVTSEQLNQASEANDENHSPYGISEDWYMSMGLLNTLGLPAEPANLVISGLAKQLWLSNN